MTAHIPHRKLEALAQWFQALAATIPPADDTASATLYRSEIALVVLALDTLAAGQSFGATTEAGEAKTHQRPSLGDWVTPWNDHQDEPAVVRSRPWGDETALETVTEEEFLKSLEGLTAVGSQASRAELVARARRLRLPSTRPKEYGEGKLGPVPVPPPSVSLSSKPSCSPRFGIADSRLNTDSGNGTNSAEAALHTAHNEGVREGNGLG